MRKVSAVSGTSNLNLNHSPVVEIYHYQRDRTRCYTFVISIMYRHRIALVPSVLLNVFSEESPMKVIADGVIHESLLRLRLRSCLSFENNVVIPPVARGDSTKRRWPCETAIKTS